MNPNPYPKSELTLSAGPKVDRRIARTRNAIVAAVCVAILIIVSSLQGVQARGPLPLPSPWPSGSLQPIVHPSCDVRHPCATPAPPAALPDTDAAP